MRSSFYLALPIMIVLAIFQTAVLARYPLFGFAPQLPFLVALGWGLLRDAEEGVLWAFTAGFMVDLFSVTPFGLTPLIWMITVLAMIQLAAIFPTNRFILPSITAALGTLLYLALLFLLLRLFGWQTSTPVIAALPPLSILHGILILPVYWLMYTVDRRLWPRRVEV